MLNVYSLNNLSLTFSRSQSMLRPSKTFLFMIPDLYFYGNGGCPKIDGRKYKEK